jgi:hypothetical protein
MSRDPHETRPAKLSREARTRIRRRAHSLALFDYERMVKAMEQDLEAGKLQPAGIETWEPPTQKEEP